MSRKGEAKSKERTSCEHGSCIHLSDTGPLVDDAFNRPRPEPIGRIIVNKDNLVACARANAARFPRLRVCTELTAAARWWRNVAVSTCEAQGMLATGMLFSLYRSFSTHPIAYRLMTVWYV